MTEFTIKFCRECGTQYGTNSGRELCHNCDKINNSNIKQTNKFCPLINDYCKQNCVCFVEASFYESKLSIDSYCRFNNFLISQQ